MVLHRRVDRTSPSPPTSRAPSSPAAPARLEFRPHLSIPEQHRRMTSVPSLSPILLEPTILESLSMRPWGGSPCGPPFRVSGGSQDPLSRSLKIPRRTLCHDPAPWSCPECLAPRLPSSPQMDPAPTTGRRFSPSTGVVESVNIIEIQQNQMHTNSRRLEKSNFHDSPAPGARHDRRDRNEDDRRPTPSRFPSRSAGGMVRPVPCCRVCQHP